jgi:SAM-dependent methyltransferase
MSGISDQRGVVSNAAVAPATVAVPSPQASIKLDLFIVSFLALFMEVMFIRWVPSYERVLAYFTNFVLIAAFLGLGLGSMLAGRRRELIRYQPPLVLLLVVVAVAFNHLVKTRGVRGDMLYSEFFRNTPISLEIHHCLIFFFTLIALEFVPLGQKIGKDLKAFSPPLNGYVINLLGSVLGVIAFSMASFLQLSPVWWFAAAMILLLWFVRGQHRLLWVNTAASLVTIGVVWSAGAGFIWSPYHKLVTSPLVLHKPSGNLRPTWHELDPRDLQTLPDTTGFHIAVDDDFLQMALDLSASGVAANPFLRRYRARYDLPYTIPQFPYKDVLIVGAGSGNDTAAALRNGAQHVDAVEIDPAIVNLGRMRHPERPFADPRVQVIVDDARSYFNRTDRKYDMVVFGLLDSHRLFSSMSSVRLDSFVFTEESFREVRRLLKEQGIVVVQHGLGAPFMANRLYKMLTDAFEMPPHVVYVPGFLGMTFVVGPGVRTFLKPATQMDTGPVEKATDDWPFFYLEGHKLPREYVTAVAAMFVISVLSVLACSKGTMGMANLHFFFLGSAFLLIETLSITRFALLFGSTWLVNSIVFAAILVVVLLATLWMKRAESVSTHLLYALLMASILLNFWFPVHAPLRANLVLRLAVAMALLSSPIFFAAFIFARAFRETPNPDLAFASNLLGAVVGGLAEYSTLVIGFRIQLLIALVIYALSYAALYLNRSTRPLVVTG